MDKNEEVKSCPFCGYSGVNVVEGSTFRWRVAQCNECEARAGEIRIQTTGPGTREEWEQEARIQAIKEWNTRGGDEMNLEMWTFIARDADADQECWVFNGMPERIGGATVWDAGSATRLEFAKKLGIPESLWPAPGECRRITRLDLVLETEAMDK